MNLVISCLGFAVYTQSKESWKQLEQLEHSTKFTELLIQSLRPQLAMRSFLSALRFRENSQEYVLMLKQVHGSFDWISKRVHPDYRW